jgi:hypothetical protein
MSQSAKTNLDDANRKERNSQWFIVAYGPYDFDLDFILYVFEITFILCWQQIDYTNATFYDISNPTSHIDVCCDLSKDYRCRKLGYFVME